MQCTFAAASAVESGTLVVGASEGPLLLPAAAKADRVSRGAVERALKASRFTGKPGQLVDILAPAGLKLSRLIVLGLGKPEEFGSLVMELVRNTYFNGQLIRLDGAIRMPPK